MHREIGPLGIAIQSLILKEYYTNINTNSSLKLASEGIDLSEVREEFIKQTEFSILTKFNEFICGCIFSAIYHRINSYVLIYMMEHETEEGKEFIASLLDFKMKIINSKEDLNKIQLKSVYRHYPKIREAVVKYILFLLPSEIFEVKYVGHIGIGHNTVGDHIEIFTKPEEKYSENIKPIIASYNNHRVIGASVILLNKPFYDYINLPAPMIEDTHIVGAGLLAVCSLWTSNNSETLNENYDT